MAIILKKGQKIDLTKSNIGLNSILVGLGWDPVEQKKGGFLASLFGINNNEEIDCDASVFMLDKDGKLAKTSDLIYFGNLSSACNGVIHTGDNLTGDGDGDDESIIINLDKIPQNIDKLLFTVNIYDCIKRNQHFGMIENAFIRVVDLSTKKELIRYNLSDNYDGKTALIVGQIYRENNEWNFGAIGEGTEDTSLKEILHNLKVMVKSYGI